jgi:hypothetical protein
MRIRLLNISFAVARKYTFGAPYRQFSGQMSHSRGCCQATSSILLFLQKNDGTGEKLLWKLCYGHAAYHRTLQ